MDMILGTGFWIPNKGMIRILASIEPPVSSISTLTAQALALEIRSF
jgi:hypothetical protein